MAPTNNNQSGSHLPYAVIPRTFNLQWAEKFTRIYSLAALARDLASRTEQSSPHILPTETDVEIVIAIVAAAGVLMIVFVLYRHATEPLPEPRNMSEEQANYMREVRQRNRADIAALVNSYRSRRGSRGW